MTDQNVTPKWVIDSATLIRMVETEWRNREERRGIHERVPWTAGWMSGYLTPDKQGIHRISVIEAAEAVGEATNRIFDLAYNLGVMHGKAKANQKITSVIAARVIFSDNFEEDGIKSGWILVGGTEPLIKDIEGE